MQSGYPIKVKIVELYKKIEPILESHHVYTGKSICCQILLLVSGFKSEDFKFGKTDIHLRSGRTHLLDQLYEELKEFNGQLAHKFKRGHISYMRHVYVIGLRFIGSGWFVCYLL